MLSLVRMSNFVVSLRQYLTESGYLLNFIYYQRRLRLLSLFSAPGSGSPSPVRVAPAGLCRVVCVFSPSSRPQAVASRPLWRFPPPASVASSPPSSRPQAVAPRPLWRLPPPAYVASSPPSSRQDGYD